MIDRGAFAAFPSGSYIPDDGELDAGHFESLSNGPADAALSRRERAAAAQAAQIADAEARMRKPAMPPKKKRIAAPKQRPEKKSG